MMVQRIKLWRIVVIGYFIGYGQAMLFKYVGFPLWAIVAISAIIGAIMSVIATRYENRMKTTFNTILDIEKIKTVRSYEEGFSHGLKSKK